MPQKIHTVNTDALPEVTSPTIISGK